GAVSLRLARETNQRLGFRCVDVAKLFNLLALTRGHIRKLSRAAKHAHPARTTRSRAALNGNRSLDASRIDLTPVLRMIVSSAPREVLNVIQLILRRVVVLIVSNSPFLVHRPQKSQEALAVVLRTFTQNLFGRLLRVF